MIKSFKISEEMIDSFAKLTGDYNSLHLNEEFARKSKYRQRVMHGMLPFSYISFLQKEFPSSQVEFLCFDTKFRQPIFPGDEIRLEVTYSKVENENFEYVAVWFRKDSKESLIESKGNFCLSSCNRTPVDKYSSRNCLVLNTLSENTYTINEIAEKNDTFSFSIDTQLTQKYRDIILTDESSYSDNNFPICNNLIATLLLSTLVGMKLPGRYATFAKFRFSFNHRVSAKDLLKLVGEVKKVSVASESIEVAATLLKDDETLGNGKLSVAINPPPQPTISCKEIQTNHMDMGLKKKVVVITGASRGIGAATAKLFAMHGAKVIVNYYKGKHDAELIVEEIEQFGGTAIPLQCDVRDESQVKHFLNTVLAKFDTINILINNAIQEATPKSYMKLEWDDYLRELEVSLKGMHNICKGVVPILKQHKSGKIINLSTIFVDNPVTGQNKYITTKSTIVGYTKSLAKELASSNIQVNFVVPNMADTDLTSCIPSELSKKIAAEREFGRNLKPIEVAHSILFLASNWADSITGQKIVLNLGEPPFG
jgi:3-oxoacyl-[acyl-carrier protein] reductase